MKQTLTRPLHAKLEKDRRTVYLSFDRSSIAPTGRYWIVGGVTWPVRLRGEFLGHAVVLGVHLQSETVYVFEEHAFATVEPVLTRSGELASKEDGVFEPYPYLSRWLGEAWTYWQCARFYYNQDELAHIGYLKQLLRSPMVQPKPTFIRADWQTEDPVLSEIYRLDGSGALYYRADGGLHAGLMDKEADPAAFIQSVHALECALVGAARRPRWSNPIEVRRYE